MIKETIGCYVDAHRDEAIEFLRLLIQINSADIHHGLDGREAEGQNFLKRFVEAFGAQTILLEPDYATMADSPECPPGHNYKGRPNLIAKFPGVGNGHSLILSGHIDTMDPGDLSAWKHAPWGAEIEDGELYGVGAADMKAGLACQIFAMKVVRALTKLKGDVTILSVVDEEGGGNGTLDLVRRGFCQADGAIISEPTDGFIATASRGVMLLRVTVEGQTGHPLYKWELSNAVEKALIIKDALYELERRWLATKCDPVMPSPGITLCMINGGISGTSIPDRCEMSFQIDMLPVDHYWNGTPKRVDGMEVRQEVMEVIRRACASDAWLSEHPPVLEWYQHVDPHIIDNDFELVQILRKNSGAALKPMFAGNDARHILKGGVPCMLYGPGYAKDIHRPNEHVNVEQYLEMIKHIAWTIVDWCGTPLE